MQKAEWRGQGWKPLTIKLPLLYGSLSHKCLEYFFAPMREGKIRKKPPSKKQVKVALWILEEMWHRENPRATAQTLQDAELTMALLEAVIPAYFQYWWDDFTDRIWHQVEDEFRIPYELPDGKMTYIHGYRDAVFSLKKRKDEHWLQETKNKGRWNDEALFDILPRDFQLWVYLWSYWKETGIIPKGTEYNLLRRPQLRQKKTESLPQFAQRCAEDVKARPEFYFVRIEVPVTKKELMEFEEKVLKARITTFYDWWRGATPHYLNDSACENKYGMCDYNQLCAGNKAPYVKKERPQEGDEIG